MDRESAYEQYRRSRAEKQRRRRINALKRRCFFCAIFLILGFCIYMMYNASIFNVTEIKCIGNNIVSSEELIEKSGLILGKNLFLNSVKRASANIMEIPYVEEVKVWRAFPSKMNIRISETTPIACVGNEKNLWVVDKNGKLLEKIEEYDSGRGIPLITGIIVENYQPGDVLHKSRNQLLADGLKCAKILENLGLLSKTTEIDIENNKDIKLSYDNRLYMYMGELDTFKYKMEFVKGILDSKKITDYEHAVLNYRTDKLYVGNEDMFAEDDSNDTEETENPDSETDADVISENDSENKSEKDEKSAETEKAEN